MTVTISGNSRIRFSADLKKHREAHAITDAQYARDVLRVSLNTFKRCIANSEQDLSLKRQTLINILENVGLVPGDYDLAISLPAHVSQFGGYDKRAYAHLCGRYFLYRRSFLTAANLNKSVLEIRQSPTQECLSFLEIHSYISDGGIHDEHRYSGDIHIDKDRAMLSLPAFRDGQVRLTLFQMPHHQISRERIKMRGALLTFGIPRGYWQPTISCVFAEGPISESASPRDLCGTVLSGSEEYHRISTELAHTEEHSVILAPLLWRKLQNQNNAKIR